MPSALKRPRTILTLAGALFCLLALSAVSAPPAARAGGLPGYAGSETCGECHEEIYRQWAMTPHARMRRDAARFPEAIAADKFTPEIPFGREAIKYVIGSHWIQKYLTEIDGELYQLPKYWNLSKQNWEPYSIFNWRSKPYNVNCFGCHTVGFDPVTKTHFEDAIGCEACHGPGAKHAASEDGADIVNPEKIDKMLADMICQACHTDGNDKVTGEFPFAAGFQAGKDLRDYYSEFFLPKPGSKKWYRGDMTYEDRNRMWMYYQTEFYSKKRACGV